MADMAYYHHEYLVLSGRTYATHLHHTIENQFSAWLTTIGERNVNPPVLINIQLTTIAGQTSPLRSKTTSLNLSSETHPLSTV